MKCDHKEYLTPEMINHYIMMNRVQCIKHGDTLKGRIGQYGVYILCQCGDERHILKPDEI